MERKYFDDKCDYSTEINDDSAVLYDSTKEFELPEWEKDYLGLDENLYRVQRARRRIIGYVKKQN